jgi:hypothetical protein
MRVEWTELPQGSHRASEEVQREAARKARKIVKRMGAGNNGSDHVLVGHMSTGTLYVVTGTLINEVPADSSRPSFIVHLWRI